MRPLTILLLPILVSGSQPDDPPLPVAVDYAIRDRVNAVAVARLRAAVARYVGEGERDACTLNVHETRFDRVHARITLPKLTDSPYRVCRSVTLHPIGWSLLDTKGSPDDEHAWSPRYEARVLHTFKLAVAPEVDVSLKGVMTYEEARRALLAIERGTIAFQGENKFELRVGDVHAIHKHRDGDQWFETRSREGRAIIFWYRMNGRVLIVERAGKPL